MQLLIAWRFDWDTLIRDIWVILVKWKDPQLASGKFFREKLAAPTPGIPTDGGFAYRYTPIMGDYGGL